ncbi:MAG: transcriptional regulator [Myxococcaceae bacterium]|nr:transcriptional regulator [Myxococcaceae bacterium]
MTLKTVKVRLLTIIAEAVLRDRLVEELKLAGASGYTVAEVHGSGFGTVRASEWAGPSVRFETVVTDEVAQALLAVLAERYFPSWSVVAYLQDVEVVRAERYQPSPSLSPPRPKKG